MQKIFFTKKKAPGKTESRALPKLFFPDSFLKLNSLKVHVKKNQPFDLRRFVMSRSLIEKKSIIINFIENCKFDLTKNFGSGFGF